MRRTASNRICSIVLCCTGGLSCCNVCAADDDGRALIGAGARDHIWFVADISDQSGEHPPKLRLFHHAPEPGDLLLGPVVQLKDMPQAVGAFANRVWLVFEPRKRDGRIVRDVFTSSAVWSTDRVLWESDPIGYLEAVDALPGEGALRGFVVSNGKPTALIEPAGTDDDAVETRVQLYELTKQGWAPMNLPESLGDSTICSLAAAGPNASELLLLELERPSPNDLPVLIVHSRVQEEERWRTTEAGTTPALMHWPIRSAHQALAVLDGGKDERLSLAYVRSDQLLPLTSLAVPNDPWVICGLQDRILLIEQRSNDEFFARRIDSVSGAVGEARPFTPQGAFGGATHIPILLAAAILGAAAVFVFQPNEKTGKIALPPGLLAAPFSKRAMAVLIDLIPGMLLSMVLFDARIGDLFYVPLMSARPTPGNAYMLMIAVASIHGTLSEVVWSRSIGKSILGLRVARYDGSRPRLRAVLVRGLLKFVVLMLPILGVLTIASRNGLGLPEVIARLAIVEESSGSDEAERHSSEDD